MRNFSERKFLISQLGQEGYDKYQKHRKEVEALIASRLSNEAELEAFAVEREGMGEHLPTSPWLRYEG